MINSFTHSPFPIDENIVSNGGIQNNTKPKEIPNSQMSRVSDFSQDPFKESGSSNPFSGLRSQLQNLRQKASNLTKDSPPKDFQPSQTKENAFSLETNPPKLQTTIPTNPFNSRLNTFLGGSNQNPSNNNNQGILKPTSVQSSQSIIEFSLDNSIPP